MKTACVLLMALCCAAVASGQDVVKAVDISHLSNGSYVLTIEGDAVKVVPLLLIKPNVAPHPSPELNQRSKTIASKAAAVAGDQHRAETASLLAELYRRIADQIDDGTLQTQQEMQTASAFGIDTLLSRRNVAAAWKPVREQVSDYWVALVQEGKGAVDYSRLLRDVAVGLDASADNAQRLDIALILDIIKLMRELIDRQRAASGQ